VLVGGSGGWWEIEEGRRKSAELRCWERRRGYLGGGGKVSDDWEGGRTGGRTASGRRRAGINPVDDKVESVVCEIWH
jgi:hypothetical protein